MALSAAEKTRRYQDKIRTRGDREVRLWVTSELNDALDAHRGDQPKANFIRDILAKHLAWLDKGAEQVDLLDYLAYADAADTLKTEQQREKKPRGRPRKSPT